MSGATRPRSIALLGAGRLARVLGLALVRAGYPVTAVASRRGRSAAALARRLGRPGHPVQALPPGAAVATARVVLLAVPDDALAPLARHLAESGPTWRGRIVLHHAGARGSDLLRPLSRAGAAVGVLHPLQTFGDLRSTERALAGSRARVEGDPKALALARRLARDLGLVPLPLLGGTKTGAEHRELYHAAASLASNDLIGLLDLAGEVLGKAGLGSREALAALLPLARNTLDQLERAGAGQALTGPVVRGDVDTVRAHLRRLARRSPVAGDVHRLLSGHVARIAARERRLTEARRRELRALLSGGAKNSR